MLTITQIPVGGLDDNFAYLVVNHDTDEALIVDSSGEWGLIAAAIAKLSLSIRGILITHTDHDHIDALPQALAAYPAPVYVHHLGAEAVTGSVIRPIDDHDHISLGSHEIEVRHTPGHTDDSVCFYIVAESAATKQPLLITGDTLFVHGCGRTTQTQVKDLYESLQELKAFPDNTIIYPGHDYGPTPTSTIGEEKAHNRFFLAPNFNAFTQKRLG